MMKKFMNYGFRIQGTGFLSSSDKLQADSIAFFKPSVSCHCASSEETKKEAVSSKTACGQYG